MRLKTLLPMLVLAMPFAAPAQAAVKASDVVAAATDGFIRPAYADLHDRAAELQTSMAGLCSAPSPQRLDAARQDFAQTVAAWSRVETIRFGPVSEENRLERLLYWPDRKGIGLKQVQAALAEKDAGAASAATLAGKSVAMQGFGALEFVLYGTGADALATAAEPYRCSYGAAIAGNIRTIAGAVSDAWTKPDGFAAQWANPGPANPLYRDGTEAVTELVEVFVNGLELVRDVRLHGFLGRNPELDKPKQALFWRSGLTTASLAANMAGMKALFDESHLGDALPDDQKYLVQSIDAVFANAVAALGTAGDPVADALTDPVLRDRLAFFSLATTTLSELFGTRLSGAFGLTAGFSSLDGD